MPRTKKKTLSYYIAKRVLKKIGDVSLDFSPRRRKAEVKFVFRGTKFKLSVEHYISHSQLKFPVPTSSILEKRVLWKREEKTKLYIGYSLDKLKEKYPDIDFEDEIWLKAIDALRKVAAFPRDMHFSKELKLETYEDIEVTLLERDPSKFSNLS